LSLWKKTCGCVIYRWDLWAVMNARDPNLLQGTKKLINENLSIFSLRDYCSQGSLSMGGSHSVSLSTKSVIYLPRAGKHTLVYTLCGNYQFGKLYSRAWVKTYFSMLGVFGLLYMVSLVAPYHWYCSFHPIFLMLSKDKHMWTCCVLYWSYCPPRPEIFLCSSHGLWQVWSGWVWIELSCV